MKQSPVAMQSQYHPVALPRRVVVVGTTGSGKTTLARQIAAVIGGTHVELDALFHEPGWKPAEPEVFRARVSAALDRAPVWTADGNYSIARDIVWERAELLVWLDYPFPRVFSQLVRRTVRRYVRREVLWNGNREQFWNHFVPNDESLFYWAIKTHWRRRRTYPQDFARPELAHLKILRLRDPRATRRFLARLRSAAP